jgi:hypothetical protein
MLARIFVPLSNFIKFIINNNESHNYISLLSFVIFIVLFMSLFMIFMDIAIYKKKHGIYNKIHLAIAFFILFLLFFNILMLIGFPNIYGFFIKYFLCLTILTEVICLFTEVICLFIEFNIFVPVMTFLFTDIPIYLRMNVVYIRLKDS